jgi:hypothetical protein
MAIIGIKRNENIISFPIIFIANNKHGINRVATNSIGGTFQPNKNSEE